MKQWNNLIEKADTIAISGHVRPDGDCVGSCCALFLYLQNKYNQNGLKKIHIYLENIADSFLCACEGIPVEFVPCEGEHIDLYFALDAGSIDRLGNCCSLFEGSKHKVCIDHHISNTGYADENFVKPHASSTSEVLFELFDEDKIDKQTAVALYLGIIHDTGVFKHSNTGRRTMEIAGILIEKGAEPAKLIDETFYKKTYLQNQILGRCLMESILLLDGKIIVSTVSKRVQELYNTSSFDFEGVIDQLRITKGVEVAILLIEDGVREYKVSMRSNGCVDVSKIASFFGGGGHIKAAGCKVAGELHDVINNITVGIEHQLEPDKVVK